MRRQVGTIAGMAKRKIAIRPRYEMIWLTKNQLFGKKSRKIRIRDCPSIDCKMSYRNYLPIKRTLAYSIIVCTLSLLGQLFLAPEIFARVQTGALASEPIDKLSDRQNASQIEIVNLSPLIVVKGNVNGRPANVIFDTGSWPNAIGNHLESELEGPIESVVSGNERFDVCPWQNLAIGELKSADAGRICLLDLAMLSEEVGIEIDAIAGTPFAVGRVFEIDFENERFAIGYGSSDPFEVDLEIEFDELGRPFVQLKIGNRSENFLVDTGFEGFVTVDAAFGKYLKENGIARDNGEKSMQVYADGFKTSKMSSLYIEKQEVFGYEFRHLPVLVGANSKADNSIGLALLKCFNVSLDLAQGKMRLNRNKIHTLSDGCTVLSK